jgi:predicted lipoprotein
MKASKILRCPLSLCLAAVVLAACSSGGGTRERAGALAEQDFAKLLDSAVNEVIVPTYAALHEEATKLEACTASLAEEATDEKLESCKKHWVAAREPWEQSEGFLFGPVADEGLDPALDSWPVDHRQLNALMESSVALTAETITSNLGGGMKGFHTIEYLLWGRNHDRRAADLVAEPREAEYLVALTEALANDTGTLLELWTGTDDETGYGERFARSGTKTGLYSTALDAVQELIGGMVGICDEVAFGKIAEPYKARDPNLIESQFSYNSLLDFSDNIRSIRNVYLGSLNEEVGEQSLSRLVADHDEALDERVRRQIDRAIDSILAIGEEGQTFRDAILEPERDKAIETAQDEIADLMDLLNGELLPLFAR